MKKSHVFLTPMSPDGKPGEVKEIEYNDGPATFLSTHAEPRSSKEVQKQIDALIAELPKLKGGARSKADHQIRLLERELRKSLDAEETARVNREREQGRKQQQPTGNTRMVYVNSTAQADPFKSAVENMQKAAPTEFRAALEGTRAEGQSVERAVRNALLK